MWDALREMLGTIVSFFYDLMPNLGVAIILLTIVVGIVLFPLTLKQTRSMKAMQEIQPELKRLQKELKQDKPALQQATMELYREKGVNPAAGCLPLLLQMPIWFALFQVLRSFASSTDPARFVPDGSRLAEALVVQNTDFLWMDMTVTPSEVFGDSGILSAIPYLITIIVVMATAYWQQRQTMSRSQQQGQQQQPGQAIMKIFPFFFGFISFTLPAGLVVYFAASQIFRIAQQAFILNLDDRRRDEEGVTPVQPEVKPEVKPEARPKPTPPVRPSGQRRPQGSKKKRGKKRRRR
jgi:YidC/Oxa1 family membrane protein insertase